MKTTNKLLSLLISVLLGSSMGAKAQDFKVAFLTDMHIHSDSTLGEVHKRLTKLPNDVDFILTGGDNVDVDNLRENEIPKGKQRMQQLKDLLDKRKKPYHLAIGNHDRLPASIRNGQNDFEVFEGVFGKPFYSFDHKGWTFIILNSVEVADKQYTLKDGQLSWLKELLKQTPTDRPIVVVTHVPFLSVYYPVLEGRYTGADTFVNQKQVFDMFEKHNLKLVLQGHMHLYEEIKVKDVQFITAGAVSGNWWHGAFHGTAPGHLALAFAKNSFTWAYIK